MLYIIYNVHIHIYIYTHIQVHNFLVVYARLMDIISPNKLRSPCPLSQRSQVVW